MWRRQVDSVFHVERCHVELLDCLTSLVDPAILERVSLPLPRHQAYTLWLKCALALDLISPNEFTALQQYVIQARRAVGYLPLAYYQ
jgi:hypothetical protein